MGQPAARVGDTTSHGTPLSPGPGSANVLIGGMPGWRATADFHTCPQVIPGAPPIPHVGGVVAMGSVTVLINNLPAARQGDMIVEAGPPNSIVMGCVTVLIG
ncbi:MAG: TypeVI sectretion system protein [Candidatus Methanomarinus sp.]|nr:MAG: TypeVI sectretion system protein [ANME-2 cluster archaeon]